MKRLLATIGALVLFAGCASNRATATPPVSSAVSRQAATSTYFHVFAPSDRHGKPKVTRVEVWAEGDSHARAVITLAPGSSCTSTSNGSLNCVAPLNLPAATHLLKIVSKVSSNVVAVNQLFVSIADCKRNDIYTALYEHTSKAPSIVVATTASGYTTGSVRKGFTSSFGGGLFNVVAYNENGAAIVGPGSPRYAISSAKPSFSIHRDARDVFDASLASGTPPDQMRSTTITVATKPAQNGGSVRFRLQAVNTLGGTPTPSPAPSPC